MLHVYPNNSVEFMIMNKEKNDRAMSFEKNIIMLFIKVMFGSRKILRKEKKCKGKLFFHV